MNSHDDIIDRLASLGHFAIDFEVLRFVLEGTKGQPTGLKVGAGEVDVDLTKLRRTKAAASHFLRRRSVSGPVVGLLVGGLVLVVLGL